MEGAIEQTSTRERRIDSGAPLVLMRHAIASEDGASADVAGYAVATFVCSNPECPCTHMRIEARPVRRLEGNRLEIMDPLLRGVVSKDGAEVEIAEDPSGAFDEAARAWIRSRLLEQEQHDWLVERWRRGRGQVGDPGYPSGALPEVLDGMVAFFEVFPYAFDLTVFHGGRHYLIEDHYCLAPGCTCNQLAAHFVDTEDDSVLGHLRIGGRHLDIVDRQGPNLLEAIWSALLERRTPAELRDRFESMRRVGRERARAKPLVSGEKIGRNDTCGCGSGKKYKRCCGK